MDVIIAIGGALTAVFTCGLFMVALGALTAATSQIAALNRQTMESSRIARLERAMTLLSDPAVAELYDFLGIVDAGETESNRQAVTEFYRANAKTSGPDTNQLRRIENGFRDSQPVNKAYEHFVDGLFRLSNYLERAEILISQDAIDENIFIENLDYHILASYYICEPVLRSMVETGNYDFEYYRRITLRAQIRYRKRDTKENPTLRNAIFEKL